MSSKFIYLSEQRSFIGNERTLKQVLNWNSSGMYLFSETCVQKIFGVQERENSCRNQPRGCLWLQGACMIQSVTKLQTLVVVPNNKMELRKTDIQVIVPADSQKSVCVWKENDKTNENVSLRPNRLDNYYGNFINHKVIYSRVNNYVMCVLYAPRRMKTISTAIIRKYEG